ncbi:hypothetical protein KP509_12G034200 [Ceratopteris richardii]|nr:hypothetical protein KP509_12G034200 [Ceratopteris richardii]
MYGKCGSLAKSQEVLDNFFTKDVVLWTSLVTAYSEHSYGADAMKCFEQMKSEGVFPNAFTFTSVLKVCLPKGMTVKVKRLHVEIELQGLLVTDLVLGNALVDAYGKSGMLALGLKVFDKLPVRDFVSWSTLISSFVNDGKFNQVIMLFQQMIHEGVSPNSFTYAHYLKACNGLGSACRGKEAHMEIEKKGLLDNNHFIGAILVGFYAKVGLMMEAKTAFTRILIRDVVVWTSLIGGFSQHGYSIEALDAFEDMQLDGTSPNATTFAFVLEACKNIEAIKKGLEIHGEIERRDFLTENIHLGNSLVDMYAQFGMVAKSQEVFEFMFSVNLVSWNALISGYVENGHAEGAISLYAEMIAEGFVPDSITYICILRACGSLHCVRRGQLLHSEIEKRGFLESDIHISSALVCMYANCGLMDVARLVFDMLQIQVEASWSALIAGYVDQGYSDAALVCFEKMQTENISPSLTTLIYILKACGDAQASKKGIEIHSEIERQGLFEIDDRVSRMLATMYIECGLLAFAQQVLNRMSFLNAASAAAVLKKYARNGKEVMDLIESTREKSFLPNAYSYVCSLKLCTKLQMIDRELHAEIERKGLLEKNRFIGNSLIAMYATSRQMKKAEQVFESLQVRDIVSWNVLISGYINEGNCEQALKCLDELQFLGICPDARTFILRLQACSEVGNITKGGEIYLEMGRQGLVGTDLHIGSALIEMFTKLGSLEKAQEVFDKFDAHGLVLWNVLLAGYAEQGRAENALKCLEEMQLEGICPSIPTYLACIKACSEAGATDKGIELHAELGRKDLLEELLLGSSLVDMYSNCGKIHMAQEVFDMLPSHDVVSWTALLAGYSHLGEGEHIFPLFKQMLEESIKPDPVIFLVVLGACKHRGLINKGLSFYESMSKDYGVSPSVDHSECVVDLLGRAGQIHTAVELICRMQSSSDFLLWDTILAACRYWGSMKYGRLAFHKALLLNGKDAMACVDGLHLLGY